ncbi:hypothetical protein Tco_0823884 [Tanacetum coccineum]|uniref:Uncharacterized protein n=1 Tax=Tanacetum coccineum TaxID=301880 RepID=A0ABQ5AJ90_9ASTR
MGPSLGQPVQPPQSQDGRSSACLLLFTPLLKTARGTNTTEPSPQTHSIQGSELGADNLTWKGVANDHCRRVISLSLYYETLVSLMHEETKKKIKQRGNRPDFTSVRRTKYLHRATGKDKRRSLDNGAPRWKGPPSSESEVSRRKCRQKYKLVIRRLPGKTRTADAGHGNPRTDIVELKTKICSAAMPSSKGRRIFAAH